ncbi:DNA polymerase III subunit gamma/tau [Kiritimatiellota bacterium B12222]|nr:DNA polymerase III subunit gamma/tau [Kiritimatiellota bacterium B12222]
MAYEVLARKYRPQTFTEVVGQSHITDTLGRAIDQERIGHAYLFVGSRGTGKTTMARIFAKCLNCENGPTANPCNTCSRCKEITAGNSMDVLEIDGASNNKVEHVREIRENAKFGTNNSLYKIYLIDEVHMLTQGAFNALLKTLEEPPPHVKFLFATTEPQKIPDTILSRCQRFDLRRILAKDITGRLQEICDAEGVEVEEKALLAVARGARGGMRDALSAMDQLISFRGKTLREEDVLSVFGLVSQEHLEKLAAAILKHDVPGILDAIAEFDQTGKDLERVLLDLVIHMRHVLVQAYSPQGGLLNELPDIQAAVIREQAEWVDASRVSALMEKLIGASEQLKYSLSKRTLLETSLIAAARTANFATLDEVWVQVDRLKSGLPEVEKKK